LIELLVVIAIIGVLATIIVSALGDARDRANRAKFKATMRSFQTALEFYNIDNGYYPYRTTDDFSWSTWASWTTSFRNWDEFRTEMGPYIDMDGFQEVFTNIGEFHQVYMRNDRDCQGVLFSSNEGQGYRLFFSLSRYGNEPIEPYYFQTSGHWHNHCIDSNG